MSSAKLQILFQFVQELAKTKGKMQAKSAVKQLHSRVKSEIDDSYSWVKAAFYDNYSWVKSAFALDNYR